MPTIKYPRVVWPCSHHSRTIGGLATANSIAYPKGQGCKLHLPQMAKLEGIRTENAFNYQ